MKEIIERRIEKALNGAWADGVRVDSDDDANSISADEVVDLMMRDMEWDTMLEESVI